MKKRKNIWKSKKEKNIEKEKKKKNTVIENAPENFSRELLHVLHLALETHTWTDVAWYQ